MARGTHRWSRNERRERAKAREDLAGRKKEPYWEEDYPHKWVQVNGAWHRNPDWHRESDWLPPGTRDSSAWMLDGDGIDRHTYANPESMLQSWFCFAADCEREGANR